LAIEHSYRARAALPEPALESTAEADGARGPHGGFAAHLEGVTLFDLIQRECLHGSRNTIQVESGDDCRGLLFFRDGNLVHAVSPGLVGEDAVLAMLRWPAGLFEHCPAAWPHAESVTVPWQTLLLRAAHAADEEANQGAGAAAGAAAAAAAAAASKVLPFPAQELPPVEGGAAVDAAAGSAEKPAAATVEVVHLGPGGRVMGGNAGPVLTDAVAYAVQLADIVGELLGLDGFLGMEMTLSNQHRCLISRAASGDVLAVKGGPGADLEAVLRQIEV
jgi:hypothetical protein